MNKNEVEAVVQFLMDNEGTDQQWSALSDATRDLSIADQEQLLNELPGGPLYTELSMRDREMGRFSRY